MPQEDVFGGTCASLSLGGGVFRWLSVVMSLGDEFGMSLEGGSWLYVGVVFGDLDVHDVRSKL